MKVLVTGAAGRVGRAVSNVLMEEGYEVRGTDIHYRRDFEGEWMPADLLDGVSAYRLVEGCEAVVHLGNHPHLHRALPPQRIYAENVTMNANVFQAALDVGVRRIVFSSSVQAVGGERMLGRNETASELKYLPLDSDTPAHPGNLYALSKVAGERMLRLYTETVPDLAATALRLPWMFASDYSRRYLRRLRTKPSRGARLDEVFAYLHMVDAGRLVHAILRRQQPGYHQYLPAADDLFVDLPVEEVVEQFYAGVEVRGSLEGRKSLVDISRITEEVGWCPQEPPLREILVDEASESEDG